MLPPTDPMISELAANAKRRGLVLFLGAGVNGTALPQWEDLLERLLERALSLLIDRDEGLADPDTRKQVLKWITAEHDVYARASLVKALLGADYLSSLRELLYDSPGKDGQLDYSGVWDHLKASLKGTSKAFAFLSAIVELCQRPEIRAVATFNFDNLLETAMKLQVGGNLNLRSAHSIAGQSASSPPPAPRARVAPLPVYHIHGLVAVDPDELGCEDPHVVFSRDEYLNVASKSFDWETTTPLHLLRNYCSLWLGTSLTDWNMLRLVQTAGQPGSNLPCYCLEADEGLHARNGWSEDVFRLARRFRATLLEDAGVTVIRSGKGYDSLPDAVKQIAACLGEDSSER